METQEAKEYVKTDPNLTTGEKEFTVGFTKKDNRARLHTNISSQIKRALNHSEIKEIGISVYNENTDTCSRTTTDDFDGDGIIVSFRGTVPIECLKIQANPRGGRSYAAVISPQNEVSFD